MILSARAEAHALPLRDESVECAVTSPPYWGLRDYGIRPSVFGGHAAHAHEWVEVGREGVTGDRYAAGAKRRWQHSSNGRGEVPFSSRAEFGENWADVPPAGELCACGAWRGCLGLEAAPELYVAHLVEILRDVWRVLRKDGTLWLNLGDCYCAAPPGPNAHLTSGLTNPARQKRVNRHRSRLAKRPMRRPPNRDGGRPELLEAVTHRHGGWALKPKDLVGIPWMVAFALRADGWWLRSEVIWRKTNPMPESVKDRPTRSHETLFLLSKSRRYYFDEAAVREPSTERASRNGERSYAHRAASPVSNHSAHSIPWRGESRMVRTVWTFPTRPYKGAHFATFPEDLVEVPILAGSRRGGTVLDPFAGTGTVARVAIRLGRRAVLCDLSQEYLRDHVPGRLRGVQVGLGL